MKKSELVELIREFLREEGNATGAVGPLAVPAAFTPPGQKGPNAATRAAVKQGMKPVKMKKRPYDTKGFSYLDENK